MNNDASSNAERMQCLHLLKWTKEMMNCIDSKNYGKAYAFLLLIFKVRPEMKYFYEDEFSVSWKFWSGKLMELGKVENVYDLYREGLSVFPGCLDLHYIMAGFYFQMGQKFKALQAYKTVLKLDPRHSAALECCDYLNRSIIDNWHYEMLNDTGRNEKFCDSIHAVINRISESCKEIINVIDIGSGTGIMSMYAAQTGKVNVTACEACPVMSHVGSNIVNASGFQNDITMLNCMSFDLKFTASGDRGEFHVLRKFNLAISEVFDAGAFGEGVIETLDDAWKRLLLPDSIVIPAKIRIKIACVECDVIHEKHCGKVFTNMNSSVILCSNVGMQPRQESTDESNCVYICEDEPYTSERLSQLNHKVLSEYVLVEEVDFCNPDQVTQIAESKGKTIDVKCHVTSNGFLDAAVLCFQLILDKNNPDLVLDTRIGLTTCWEQAIYPIRYFDITDFSRIPVHRNDDVTLHLVQYHDKIVLKDCTVESGGGAVITHPQLTPFDHESLRNSLFLIVDEEEVVKMNDAQYLESFSNSLKSAHQGKQMLKTKNHLHVPLPHKSITDVLVLSSKFQFLLFKLSMAHPEIRFYATECGHKIIDGVTELCTSSLGLENFFTHPTIRTDIKYNAVVIDIVERTGFLSQHVFDNLLKAKCNLKLPRSVFPSEVKIMAMVVESDNLVQRCTIPARDSKIELNIGDHLKEFKPRTLSEMDMNKTDYRALTVPYLCSTINFFTNSLSKLKSSVSTISLSAIDNGKAHAVLIWYILEMSDNITFNTMDPGNSWLQCAIMLDENLIVKAGQTLSLTMHRNCTYVYVDIDAK